MTLSGIPIPLRWASYAFPTYWAAEGLRSVMIRGWGIDEASVYESTLVIIGWQLFFLVIAVLAIKRTE